MKRSSMMRSPTFLKFFKSRHYLPGCKMLLTFMTDPASCFQIVQSYLDEGPDCYTRTRLRVHVTINYNLGNRFIVLARLYKLAKKLALHGLESMAYESLQEAERLMTSGSCFMLASLIYAHGAGFDKRMKDWCLRHVGNHFGRLHATKEWINLIPQLEPELGRQWSKLLKANVSILAAVEEEADEKIIGSLIAAHDANLLCVIENRVRDVSVDDAVNEALVEESRGEDDGWEDLQGLLSERDDVADYSKARAMLGIIGEAPVGQVTPRSSLSRNDTVKVRSALGFRDEEAKMASGKPPTKRRGTLTKLLS